MASQRVQYIFLDRSIQKVLYDYGLSHGYSQPYLNRLFGNEPGALVQDIPGHVTHMHVRFFTPWSTLAAHIGADEDKMRSIIAVAQESYLPKKVDYYVTGNEKGICQLSKSFGVSESELCSWNHINQSSVLVPGSCLVFFKRSFESGAVQLASSLQPGYIAQAAAPPVEVASLEPQTARPVVSDATDEEQVSEQAPPERTVAVSHSSREYGSSRADERNSGKFAGYYTVKRPVTLKYVAIKTGVSAVSLARLNGLPTTARLRPGSRIKLADAAPAPTSGNVSAGRPSGPSRICFESDSGKAGLTYAYYRLARGGTLKDVATKTGIPLSSLCRLNHLSRGAKLKRGQMIKLAQANLPVRPSLGRASCSIKYPTRKNSAVKRHEKSMKPARAKSVKKPVAMSRSLKRHAAAPTPSDARHAKSATRKSVAGAKIGKRLVTKDSKQTAHSTTKTKSSTKGHSRPKLARR